MHAATHPRRPPQTRPRNSITIRPLEQPGLRDDRDDDHHHPEPSTARQVHTVQPLPPHQIPEFPPEGVLLHRDDATSKVFLAVARSLLSVDNRATTVKDLADLALSHGLGCQNTSAATQAITTYLRSHNERCELENDGPLLLSHSMSGTDADDDLIPCLYSLQGGNPKKLSPNRKTNFRKNTAVWYLSRATGAPCPFARAGIRLCDYVGLGEEEPEKEQKRRRSRHTDPQVAGQKRKRSLRSCAAKSPSDTESEDDQEQPPQKKLTLRIKLNGFSATPRPQPEESQNDSDEASSSEEDSMVVDDDYEEDPEPQKEDEEEWRLPPYPRRSISIPPYTPSFEGSHPFPFYMDHRDPYRRSPSLTLSAGSPPPDSEDEADDFHITMTRTDHLPDDFSSDDESEGETQFESPGPRSPSAPLLSPAMPITVKEEPRDLQGLLDAWDDFDSGLQIDPAQVQLETHPIKSEPLDTWDWDSEPTARIKQEDLSFDSLFPSDTSLSPPSLSSTSSLATPSSSIARSPARDDIERPPSTLRLRSKTVPVFSTQPSPPTGPSLSVPPCAPTESSQSFSSPPMSPSIASLIESMNSLCSPAISPSSLALNSNPISSPGSDVVVVHTCQPCDPPITATQIEDISVYQMVLGSFHFLRRIDSDFVNLTPVVAYTKSPFPVITTIPNATIVTRGSSSVTGIWIPLCAAQAYIKDHPSEGGEFDIFLSDQLYERFPTALQDFVKNTVPARSLKHFGRQFASTLQALQEQSHLPVPPELLTRPQLHLQRLQNVMSSSPTSDVYALSSALSENHHSDLVETPLNAAEQEIFELCVVPDWDQEGDAGSSSMHEQRGSDEDEEESAGGNTSDTSSLTSLESSSPEVSGEISSIKEVGGVCAPPPPQDTASSPATASAEDGDPEPGMSVMEELAEPGDDINAPPTKRKAAGSVRTNRPLRRSKRVADQAAGHPASTPSTSSAVAAAPMSTRSRRRGSRNSLS